MSFEKQIKNVNMTSDSTTKITFCRAKVFMVYDMVRGLMKWKNTDKVDDELIFDGFCKKVRKYIHTNKNEFGIL